MTTATWDGTVIAESDDTVIVEGNHYFPIESVRTELLRPSDRVTHCPWKGDASHFDVVADGRRAEHAAWSYPAPKEAAAEIEGRIAFYPVITVSD